MFKMLKFENPSRLSGFKCSTLPLDKPTNNFAKMRRILRASGVGAEDRQDPPVLPVPTVPPYPIEMFESNQVLGHTNPAFIFTDEFLEANNLKATSPSASQVTSDDAPSSRSSPEGAVYSVTGGTVRSLGSSESDERTPRDCSPRDSEVTTLSDEASSGRQSFFSGVSRGSNEDSAGGGTGSCSVSNDGEITKPPSVSHSSNASSVHTAGTLPCTGSLNNSVTLEKCGPMPNNDSIPNSDDNPSNGTVPKSDRNPNDTSGPNEPPRANSRSSNSVDVLPASGSESTGSSLPNGGLIPTNGSGTPLLKRSHISICRESLPNGGLVFNSGPVTNGVPISNGGPIPNGGPVPNGGLIPNSSGPVPRFPVPTHGTLHNGRGPAKRGVAPPSYIEVMTSGRLISTRPPHEGQWPVRHPVSGRPVAKSASLSLSGSITPVHRGRIGRSLNFPRPGQQPHQVSSRYPSSRHRMARDFPPPPRPEMTGGVGQEKRIAGAGAPPYRPSINHSKAGHPSGDQVDQAAAIDPPNGRNSSHPSITTAQVTPSKASFPIYSQVCKAKKARKARSDDAVRREECSTTRGLTMPRSPAAPSTLVRRNEQGNISNNRLVAPPRPDGSPLYEDLAEFEDDRAEERQYNIEVKIDYSRGSKYQMETRHVVTTRNRNGERTQQQQQTPPPEVIKTTPGSSKDRREKTISRKLREVGEMKNFRLGVIHVIRLGKWRFVALCCCGNTSRYVHQPGRIEDYVPGYSSLAEKELKRNPDADVKLESQSQEPPPVSVNHRFGSQMMSMTHALKESGYESDSTLVFKKREDARRLAPDPRKTSQVYRQIQRGGDIPITGLQKPNPPKPKESPYKYESGEVNIHYRTPVRIEQKESIPEEELARRQEEHMKKVYENERRKKYLAELEDIERRRHTDNFTPLQKSPIPLNRYDDESSLGTMRGVRTPDLKQVAKALYNFSAQNKREISFNKGDVVFIRRQIDKNWYEGEHRGSVGIFPCNYVEIVPYDSIRTLTRKPTEGQARARFNFQAQTSMEMSLSKGELVVLTRRVDENWYEGRIGNRKGIFPVSYVDTLMEPGADRPLTPSSSPMPRPALPAANLLYNGASSYSSPYSTLGRPGSQNDSRPYHQSLTVNTQQEPVPYRALYNYKPQNDDELELLENDLVMVMEKCDDGWFVGTSRRTGLFGTFPGNYVEKV